MSVALHHRLEGPDGAPVLVPSNSLGAVVEQPEQTAREVLAHLTSGAAA